MNYFLLHPEFWRADAVHRIPRAHRKEAIGAFTTALSWSAEHRLRGYVPQRVLTDLGIPDVVTDRLVHAGLWERTADGVVDGSHGLTRWPTEAEAAGFRQGARDGA